jgi:hypothetical protein
MRTAEAASREKKGNGLWVASSGHSLVGPALIPLKAIAQAAGYEGHNQIALLSGGANGSPRSLWEKSDDKQILKPALATGKWDVLTMGSHYQGSEPEDFARWIELGLKYNPAMVFYIQDAWPRLPDLLPNAQQGAEPAEITFERYLGQMQEINRRMAAIVEALNKRLSGKVYVIPVGNGMVELVRRQREGKLPGVDAIYIPKKKDDGKRVALYRDQIHPTAPVATLEGYLYYACLYKKDPADLPGHVYEKASLDRILREVAWKVVSEHPYTGVKKANP